MCSEIIMNKNNKTINHHYKEAVLLNEERRELVSHNAVYQSVTATI